MFTGKSIIEWGTKRASIAMGRDGPREQRQVDRQRQAKGGPPGQGRGKKRAMKRADVRQLQEEEEDRAQQGQLPGARRRSIPLKPLGSSAPWLRDESVALYHVIYY